MQALLIVIFATLCATAIAGGAWGALAAATAGGEERRLRQRLRRSDRRIGQQPAAGPAVGAGRRSGQVRSLLVRAGERLAAPFLDEKTDEASAGRLRRKLLAAGIYSSNAYKLVVGARIVFLVVGLLLGYAAGGLLGVDWMLAVPVGGLMGHVLPTVWLAARIRDNHRQLERGLPDAMDLLVVCVEAGLTIDAAIQRVADEMHLAHPVMSRELSICHMETRIGVPRSEALSNLGRRSSFAPLQTITAMLAQADRFGTSIAGTLRVQADSMRRERQLRGEEAAAKATVKLSFPLVLFIFPASFLVLAGPMIINFMSNGFFGGS